MGVAADSSNRAFSSEAIDMFMKRVYTKIPEDELCPVSDRNTNHVLLAVDPAGGGASQFAIFSLLQMPNGSIMVCGQFASRSPCHMSASSSASVTYCSGHWQQWR